MYQPKFSTMKEYKISNNGEGVIPKGETEISDGAFKRSKELNSIVIPDGVTAIGDEAFAECTNLKRVVIPNSLEYIGFSAFYNCAKLTSITIPEKVDKIHPYTFAGCGNLSSIRVAEDNKYYDSRNDCNAIIETESNTLLLGCSRTFIPNTVTKIGVSAFTRCNDLTSILIPRSVTSIESGAFAFCSNLRSINIPDSIVSIGQEAFYRCENLTSVILPENGIEIAKDAFDGSPYKENNKNSSTNKEDKVTVTFTYKGQLDFSIEGECTMEMTAKELEQFKLLNQQAKDEDVDDVLAYFEENMEKSLYDDIDCVISNMVRYNDAKECINHKMLDCFEDMDQDEFDSMTEEELIERFLDDNCDGIYEYLIESIEIKE